MYICVLSQLILLCLFLSCLVRSCPVLPGPVLPFLRCPIIRNMNNLLRRRCVDLAVRTIWRKGFILFFKLSKCKIASAARNVCPPNSSDDLCIFFWIYPSSMVGCNIFFGCKQKVFVSVFVVCTSACILYSGATKLYSTVLYSTYETYLHIVMYC